MKLRKALSDFIRAVADEAERNPEFANRVASALGLMGQTGDGRGDARTRNPAGDQRPKNRRPLPVLDPVEIARNGESALRARLSILSIEQLKDIVAAFGMDPGKLALKWKTPERIVERIVETAMARAQKGDAFRGEGKARGGAEGVMTFGEINYRGYQLVPVQDGDAWRVQIRAATATLMPPAELTMKFSDRAGAIANAKESLDLFLQGKWR